MPGIGGYPSLRFGEHRSGWQLIHEPGRIGRNGYLDTPLRIACHILPGDHIVQVGPLARIVGYLHLLLIGIVYQPYGVRLVGIEISCIGVEPQHALHIGRMHRRPRIPTGAVL